MILGHPPGVVGLPPCGFAATTAGVKPRPLLVLWLMLGLAPLGVRAQTAAEPVDFPRARTLFERQRDGGTQTISRTNALARLCPTLR